MMFPVWLLQFLVIGALVLCSAGVAALVAFLILDLRDKKIW
ncbi:hypothetical protein Poly41_54580 [Novipirellula artificiosorum]|uniref:Uncharacterized protein n=1 Tax=Novipirellula artificiosorum TaxID=2528016 RepID=A0A5C6D6N0_9BACT|nr:hypothetical protein Poly41_54580 [Novipirellula artificiosorum]